MPICDGPMLSRMKLLTRLRAVLQASSTTLDDEAAKDGDEAAALKKARLAAQCRNLDREIAALAVRTWKPSRR